MMTTVSLSKKRQEGRNETEVRARILDAAFAAFMKSGYAASSTLEIATAHAFRNENCMHSWATRRKC